MEFHPVLQAMVHLGISSKLRGRIIAKHRLQSRAKIEGKTDCMLFQLRVQFLWLYPWISRFFCTREWGIARGVGKTAENTVELEWTL